jgi:hypothetical protein
VPFGTPRLPSYSAPAAAVPASARTPQETAPHRLALSMDQAGLEEARRIIDDRAAREEERRLRQMTPEQAEGYLLAQEAEQAAVPQTPITVGAPDRSGESLRFAREERGLNPLAGSLVLTDFDLVREAAPEASYDEIRGALGRDLGARSADEALAMLRGDTLSAEYDPEIIGLSLSPEAREAAFEAEQRATAQRRSADLDLMQMRGRTRGAKLEEEAIYDQAKALRKHAEGLEREFGSRFFGGRPIRDKNRRAYDAMAADVADAKARADEAEAAIGAAGSARQGFSREESEARRLLSTLVDPKEAGRIAGEAAESRYQRTRRQPATSREISPSAQNTILRQRLTAIEDPDKGELTEAMRTRDDLQSELEELEDPIGPNMEFRMRKRRGSIEKKRAELMAAEERVARLESQGEQIRARLSGLADELLGIAGSEGADLLEGADGSDLSDFDDDEMTDLEELRARLPHVPVEQLAADIRAMRGQ